MPNYYAHLRFGAQVLTALPEHLRFRLEEECGAYTLGQYGPDPLYFCYDRRARALGREIHHNSARLIMERLRPAVEMGRSFSAGYAAGFLCHFALDSRCHAYIRQHDDRGYINHAAIEAEFDRFLMVCDGVDLLHDTPMPTPRMPAAYDDFLEKYVYPGMKGWQYREGLDIYKKLSVWHTRAARSKLVGRSFDLMTKGADQGKRFRDMALKREATVYETCNEEMLELLQNEVTVTVEKLSDFLCGKPLDDWYDRDFHGSD